MQVFTAQHLPIRECTEGPNFVLFWALFSDFSSLHYSKWSSKWNYLWQLVNLVKGQTWECFKTLYHRLLWLLKHNLIFDFNLYIKRVGTTFCVAFSSFTFGARDLKSSLGGRPWSDNKTWSDQLWQMWPGSSILATDHRVPWPTNKTCPTMTRFFHI